MSKLIFIKPSEDLEIISIKPIWQYPKLIRITYKYRYFKNGKNRLITGQILEYCPANISIERAKILIIKKHFNN